MTELLVKRESWRTNIWSSRSLRFSSILSKGLKNSLIYISLEYFSWKKLQIPVETESESALARSIALVAI